MPHEKTIRFYSSPRHGVKYSAKITPLLTKQQLYKHEFMSNFQYCKNGVEVDGVYGTTSEHVFQALRWRRAPSEETPDMATLRRDYVHEIAAAKTPSDAYKMAHSPKRGLNHFRLDPDADYKIMLHVLYAKFRQNPELLVKLKATGDARLVEHTARDRRWGDGGDGSGSNWLGKILMKVRSEACGGHASE